MGVMLSAKDLAIRDVAQMVLEQGVILDGLTAQQAATRAWRHGGPSVEALTRIALARGCRDDSARE